MSILHKSNKKESSRLQINIKGVKDEVLLLPNNEYRALLEISSINFELKSEAEQDVLIETYQSFLNSLPCPMQIILRVREMDMTKYLGLFKGKIALEKQAVYKSQIKNYTSFVRRLVSTNKILSRSFYIVLPYRASETTDLGIINEQLKLNCDIVAKGLGRLGIRVRRLSSVEILDLFYSFYNPEQAKLRSVSDQTLRLLEAACI